MERRELESGELVGSRCPRVRSLRGVGRSGGPFRRIGRVTSLWRHLDLEWIRVGGVGRHRPSARTGVAVAGY